MFDSLHMMFGWVKRVIYSTAVSKSSKFRFRAHTAKGAKLIRDPLLYEDSACLLLNTARRSNSA